MARSLWKGPYYKIYKSNYISRSSVILPHNINKTYKVYNGKQEINVKVTEEMVGRKFGEFSWTKKPAKHGSKS